MKVSKTLVLKIVIGLAIAFIIANVLGYLNVLRYIKTDVRKGEQRQIRLLSETDYRVLLEACRQLSSRVASGELKPQQYNVRLNPDPEALRLPQPILDLEPAYVIIGAHGSVQIELHGGFLHYGVMAYPKDYKEPPGAEYGDRKLIDGLWYYNEDYKGNTALQKRIEALIEKGKMGKANVSL